MGCKEKNLSCAYRRPEKGPDGRIATFWPLDFKAVKDVPGYFLPILNILVPQTGQVPWVAGRAFFMVMALAPFISRLVRHFMQ